MKNRRLFKARKTHLIRRQCERPLMLEKLELRQVFAADIADLACPIPEMDSELLDDSYYVGSLRSANILSEPTRGRERIDWIDDISQAIANPSFDDARVNDLSSAYSDRFGYVRDRDSLPLAKSHFQTNDHELALYSRNAFGGLYDQRSVSMEDRGFHRYSMSASEPSISAIHDFAEGESNAVSMGIPFSQYSAPTTFFIIGLPIRVEVPNSSPARSESIVASISEPPAIPAALRISQAATSDTHRVDSINGSDTIATNTHPRVTDLLPSRSELTNSNPSTRINGSASFESLVQPLANLGREMALQFAPSIQTIASSASVATSVVEGMTRTLLLTQYSWDSIRSSSNHNLPSEAASRQPTEIRVPTPRGMTSIGSGDSPLADQKKSVDDRSNRSMWSRMESHRRTGVARKEHGSIDLATLSKSPLPIPSKMMYLEWSASDQELKQLDGRALPTTQYALASINPLGVLQIFVAAGESDVASETFVSKPCYRHGCVGDSCCPERIGRTGLA